MSSANTWEDHLAHYRAADALFQSGQVRSALRAFRRALELATGDVDTLWALGDCYSDLGQPWRAERFFRKARAGVLWAKRGDLLYNIGNARLDQGRPAAALALYARVPKRATAFELARKNTALARKRLANKSINTDAHLQAAALPPRLWSGYLRR